MTPLALLDTDTLSEIMKGRDSNVEQKAREYLKTHGQFRFSVITRYEILRGLKVNPVRKDGALDPTLSKMKIIHFYHPRHKWRGFLTG